MKTWRLVTGKVIGHSQEIERYKVLWGKTGDKNKDKSYTKKRPLKDIVLFKFNAIDNEKYGNSIIHPVLPLLEIKEKIERNTAMIVQRYAAPIIHAKVGNDTHLPSDDDISNVKAELRDIYADTEYVTNPFVDLNVLGFEGKALNVDNIMKRIDMNILAGLQTPAVMMGMGETKKEAAEVQLRTSGRHIKAIQRLIKIEFEDKVIVGQGLGSSKDKLIWGTVEEREEEMNFDILRGLVKDGIITPQKANSLLPEEYHEKLPEIDTSRIGTPGNPQNQYPYQKGPDKVKDKPNDPTKKQKDQKDVTDNRFNKTDKEVPIKK